MTEEIKFTQEEWEEASDFSARLLEALGAQRQTGHCIHGDDCPVCARGSALLPNYHMKHLLARILRNVRTR